MYLDLCFDINVKDDEDIAEELKLSDNIVAVESPAFFRAYKPSLEALQRMNFERLHFRFVVYTLIHVQPWMTGVTITNQIMQHQGY